MKIGFVGQGYVGKNLADNLESRGFEVVRYALEAAYTGNKAFIAECDVVFIAVPTPTREAVFRLEIVEEALSLVPKGKIAVIKSTVVPGTTEALQKKMPDITILCSPEFLSEKTAREDTDHPTNTIIGLGADTDTHRNAAAVILNILPKGVNEYVCKAREAEIFKYLFNCFGYTKTVFLNVFYDLAVQMDADWEIVQKMIEGDPMVANEKRNKAVHKGGRGAGGNCLLKDFVAFKEIYARIVADEEGVSLLNALEKKNLALLKSTNKDQDLVKKVYGTKSV